MMGTFQEWIRLPCCTVRTWKWVCLSVIFSLRRYDHLPEPLNCGHPADVLQLHQLPDLSVEQRLMLPVQPPPFLEHLQAGAPH